MRGRSRHFRNDGRVGRHRRLAGRQLARRQGAVSRAARARAIRRRSGRMRRFPSVPTLGWSVTAFADLFDRRPALHVSGREVRAAKYVVAAVGDRAELRSAAHGVAEHRAAGDRRLLRGVRRARTHRSISSRRRSRRLPRRRSAPATARRRRFRSPCRSAALRYRRPNVGTVSADLSRRRGAIGRLHGRTPRRSRRR